MKVCTKCKIEKDLSEFYETKTTKDGYTYNCKNCHLIYREANRDKAAKYMQHLRSIKGEELRTRKRELRRQQDYRKKLICQIRGRAKTRGIEFNLTIEDIPYVDVCPLLGCKLVPGTKDNYEYTHSVDRIDPTKGYVPGNIWVMSKKANSMKNNATKEELILFAQNVLKIFNN
jgi:hypothetical protein